MKNIDKLIEAFDTLASRWEDESAYEDFADYCNHMRKLCKQVGAKFVRMDNSPFSLVVKLDNKIITIKIKGDKIETTEDEDVDVVIPEI